jgi:hypothetical protein
VLVDVQERRKVPIEDFLADAQARAHGEHDSFAKPGLHELDAFPNGAATPKAHDFEVNSFDRSALLPALEHEIRDRQADTGKLEDFAVRQDFPTRL